jgi:hypothetical protein
MSVVQKLFRANIAWKRRGRAPGLPDEPHDPARIGTYSGATTMSLLLEASRRGCVPASRLLWGSIAHSTCILKAKAEYSRVRQICSTSATMDTFPIAVPSTVGVDVKASAGAARS